MFPRNRDEINPTRFQMAAFRGAVLSSRPAVLRHAKPLAVARPEARLAGLVAALVVTFSGSLQPALAGNFLQDAVEKKAAEIQANIQKVRRSRIEPSIYRSPKPPHLSRRPRTLTTD